jgi:hypothetical protein
MGLGRKRMSAWVVRWDWGGEHAAVDQKIAAVLPGSWGIENVKRVVEALYAAREYSPAEMLEAARRRGHNPYPARCGTVSVIREDGVHTSIEWFGEVICGHNPFLVARKANVSIDPEDSAGIAYEDLPRPLRLDLRHQSSQASLAGPLEPPG